MSVDFCIQELLGRKTIMLSCCLCLKPVLYSILCEGHIHLSIHDNTIMIQVLDGISVRTFLTIILFTLWEFVFIFPIIILLYTV